MKRRRSRGFSLLEIVMVLFLMGVCLYMVGRLTGQTFSTLRFLREKAQTAQSASLGLERLSSELREAVAVSSLSPLTFQKVDPGAPIALDYDQDPSPGANPGPPDFSVDPDGWSDSYASDAFGKNHLGQVTYQKTADYVTRKATFRSQSMTSEVATRVNDFNVVQAPTLDGQSTANNVFEVSLSMAEDRRVVVLRTIVTVPGVAP